MYFSFNQAINHITSHSFTSFLSTNLYIIRLQRFNVGVCVAWAQERNTVKCNVKHVYVLKCTLSPLMDGRRASVGVCATGSTTFGPVYIHSLGIRQCWHTVTSPMGTQHDETIKTLIKISRFHPCRRRRRKRERGEMGRALSIEGTGIGYKIS